MQIFKREKKYFVLLEEIVFSGFIQPFLAIRSISVNRLCMSRLFFMSLILVSKPVPGSSLPTVCVSKACIKRIFEVFNLVKK